MTSRPGELVILHPDAARADLGAIVPARADTLDPRADGTGLGNVIPFARPRPSEPVRAAPDVVLPADLARSPQARRRDLRLTALITLSLGLHAGVAAAMYWHEPPPLASIGLEAISVEITLGATAPAGAAPTPGENATPSAPAPEQQTAESDAAAPNATAQPQTVEVAKEETALEQKVAQPPQDVSQNPTEDAPAAVAAEAAPAESQPAIATVETPKPDVVAAAPQEPPPAAFTLLPQPQEPVEKALQVKPKESVANPVEHALPGKEHRRIAAPTRAKPVREAKAAAPSRQANGVGIGRSSNDTNYRGLVSAHLARYKRPLPDTQGMASVTFVIGGSGAVTSVRLAHASGNAGIDSEVQAMVRRASPFPPPPDGRPQSFTVPVSFRVN
jgi:protein TonB